MTSPLQQKIKITGPSVVTANRLGDGAVVYRTADGTLDHGYRSAAVVEHRPSGDALLGAPRPTACARSMSTSRR